MSIRKLRKLVEGAVSSDDEITQQVNSVTGISFTDVNLGDERVKAVVHFTAKRVVMGSYTLDLPVEDYLDFKSRVSKGVKLIEMTPLDSESIPAHFFLGRKEVSREFLDAVSDYVEGYETGDRESSLAYT